MKKLNYSNKKKTEVHKKEILGFPLSFVVVLLATLMILLVWGCGNETQQKNENMDNSSVSEKVNTDSLESTESAIKKNKKVVKIVFLGDSLTEGYGLNPTNSYPVKTGVKINRRLKEAGREGVKVEVINGGLSGDTTIGGLNRVEWFLAEKPDFLWVALGSNDGLRGLDLKVTKSNLSKIIAKAEVESVKVILAGMELPLNFGSKYREEFRKIYPDLSKMYKGVMYFPFLLQGVGGEEELNLDDGIHPNEKGYEIISDRISEFLYPLIKG